MNASIVDATIALAGAFSVLGTAVWIFSNSTGNRLSHQEKEETPLQTSLLETIRKAA